MATEKPDDLQTKEKENKLGHRRVGSDGEITYKKINTGQLMSSIQLGIQHAVGGLTSKLERDLLMKDFMTVESTVFPSDGTADHTPKHPGFTFKTYGSNSFCYFRNLFSVQSDDYVKSFCDFPLRQLSNPGASGSIFYRTKDDKFIMKTVQYIESKFLQNMLSGYYIYLHQNPRTLLPKFFGLYCYQHNSKNIRLIAMNNLLPSNVKMHQKYDLKGSIFNRQASTDERKKSSPTFKDLDFKEHHPDGIFLEPDAYSALIETIKRDCKLLESFRIMDYSLLIGVHKVDLTQKKKEILRLERIRKSIKNDTYTSSKTTTFKQSAEAKRQRSMARLTTMDSIQADTGTLSDEDYAYPSGGIPATSKSGESLLLFVGIIDILQSYSLKKKLEHTIKAITVDGDTISVHRPDFYANRFLDFMTNSVFKILPSPLNRPPSIRTSTPRTNTRDLADLLYDRRSSVISLRRPSSGLRPDGPSTLSNTGESNLSTLSVGPGSTTSDIGGSSGRHFVVTQWTEGTPRYTEASSRSDTI